MSTQKIIINRFYCIKCGQEPRSTHRHGFSACECGNYTDGGTKYIRRGGLFTDMIDTSVCIDVKDD